MHDEAMSLTMSGRLELKKLSPTLSELEAFCAKARSLGLGDNEQLHSFKTTVFGPTISWHFNIPVEPKTKVE